MHMSGPLTAANLRGDPGFGVQGMQKIHGLPMSLACLQLMCHNLLRCQTLPVFHMSAWTRNSVWNSYVPRANNGVMMRSGFT